MTINKRTFIISICTVLCFIFTHSGLAEVEKNIEKGGDEEFVYDDKGTRDPFWPLVKPSGEFISYDNEYSISDLLLEGILAEGATQNIAIINGRVVKENDKIGQFKIHRIHKDKVILFKNKIKYELLITKEE